MNERLRLETLISTDGLAQARQWAKKTAVVYGDSLNEPSLWPASWWLVVLMTLIQVANGPRIVMRTSTWAHHNPVNTVLTNVRQLQTLILIAAANLGAIREHLKGNVIPPCRLRSEVR